MPIIVDRLKEIVAALIYATEAQNQEEVLQRIADTSRELADTKYAALGIPDGKGSLRYFKVSGIAPETAGKIDHLPVGHGLIGAIMRERKVIHLTDMAQDTRSTGFPANHPPMNSFLGVPIQLGEQLFGMLYLSDKQDGSPFNETDMVLIETMASYAALTIAGSNMREQQKQFALLEERERISMELHDGIIQSLYGIGMQVELLRLQQQVAGAELTPIVNYLNDVIEDIRAFIMNLRQDRRSALSIHDCIEDLFTRLYVPEHIETHINAPDTPMPFLPSVTEGICLIATEALSNAVRHSNARTITMTGELHEGYFHLHIIDDGDGFETTTIAGQHGLGLRNMQRRARLYGGEVIIQSRTGEGTALQIKIPLP